jgi:hypothetical protein
MIYKKVLQKLVCLKKKKQQFWTGVDMLIMVTLYKESKLWETGLKLKNFVLIL